MNIIIKHSDLLKEETEAIVNTVNCIGVMGKGIALQFKQKWPENFKAYNKACKAGLVRPGKMFIYEIDAIFGRPRYIINFPTKDHWREKSKIEYIDDGLKDLIKFVKSQNIKSIAIPPLGCGNGGLKWPVIRKMIQSYFEELGNTEVHLFEPEYNPIAKEMDIYTKKPSMTIGRAVLIKLISIYNEMRYPLSKIEIQKLCYFAQVAGQDLRLEFSKNKYGPYADKIRHVLNYMNGNYLVGVGDGDKIESEISLADGALDAADYFLNITSSKSLSYIHKVANLISGFETPHGMELLSTVHWVASNNGGKLSEVIDGVYNWHPDRPEWNKRKKHIMSERHISIALEQIKNQGWL